MPHCNWSIYIEGLGETHNSDECDADMYMLEALRGLKKHHKIVQARFSAASGEENWLDPMMLEMHEGLEEKARGAALAGAESESSHPADSAPSLHEELVKAGEKANALEKQSSAAMGVRKRGEKHEGGRSSEGLHSSDSEGGVQKSAGKKEGRK